MQVSYGLTQDAWRDFRIRLKGLARHHKRGQVADIGGGANPAMPAKLIQRYRLDYTVLDVSAEELQKTPAGYQTCLLDGPSVPAELQETFRLVISRMTAEHVPDARLFHEQIYSMLRPGGQAIHFFPTLYSLPFVINRLVPERWTDSLLSTIQPHRDSTGAHGKFPAYYRWCRGPGRAQQQRFEMYTGYFGHSGRVTDGPGYLDRVPVLCSAHEWLSRFLVRRPVPLLTSYACVLLEKPRRAKVKKSALAA
jgi:SAM-dependent methyltransferase